MADKVHHWKHGWIPLDSYAAKIKAGKVSAPTAGGLPTHHYGDKRDEAVTNGEEISRLVPGIGLPAPHFVRATQDMAPGRYDGGLTLTGHQADVLLNHLDRTAEYPLTPRQTRMLAGKPRLYGTHPEQQAQSRAKDISGVIHEDVFKHITAHDNRTGQPVFSGGVQIPPYAVTKLVKHLQTHKPSGATVEDSARAAGTFKPTKFGPKPGAPFRNDNPVGRDFRNMTPQMKINAAAMMYGTGSSQHKAAIKKFG